MASKRRAGTRVEECAVPDVRGRGFAMMSRSISLRGADGCGDDGRGGYGAHRKGASELRYKNAKSAAQSASRDEYFRVSDLPAGRAEIHWDAVAHPVVMLRDTKTGEVRGFLRGGDATI